MTPILGSEVPTAGELEQGRNARLGHQVDASAATTVAAVRPAEGNELLASEGHDAVAPIPSFYPDSGFVDVNRH